MRFDAYNFIERGPDLIRLYLESIVSHSLTRKQEAKATPKELVEHNLQLVPFFANNYRGRGLGYLDLIQEGNIGLMRASKTFDGKKGFKFSTYASYWIRKKISRAIDDTGRTIRIPVHILSNTRYMHEKDQLWDATIVTSFEDFINEEGEVIDGIDTAVATEEKDGFELREAVKDVLSYLDEDECELIKMMYGVADGEYIFGRKSRGKKIQKDRCTAAEIERRAMTKLRCPSLSRKLRPFVAVCFTFLFSLSAFAQCDQITGTQVPLYWDANTEPNIDYYRLQRSDISGSSYTVVNTVLQGSDPISLTDFNPLPTGYYVVSAVNTSGLESGLSNELCVMTAAIPPDPPPGSPPSPTSPSFEIIIIPGD